MSTMDNQINEIKEYLIQLREPQSFKQLQEVFHDVDSETLKAVVNDFHEQKKINVISLFMSNKVKCGSVRIEYIEVEKHPKDQEEVNQEDNKDKQENSKQSVEKNEKFQYKKHEDLNDEQLLEYKNELIGIKSGIEDKKKDLNTKSDRLKKIQERNQMKEIAGGIFQRIANIKNVTTKEIFQEYGLDNNEK